MAYLPKRGDIVHLTFDPSSGKKCCASIMV